MEADRAPRCFLGRRLPPLFERRVIVLAPGHYRLYDDAEWRDALFVVERGQLGLERLDGHHQHFERGAILWLQEMPLRALHNPGRTPAVLVAVARRAIREQR